MPLRPAPGPPRPEQNYIRFPMQDARQGGVVICRITEEALRKLSGSPVHCMQTMFERYRRLAENLASAKFDAGQGCPVVTPSDVSGAKAPAVASVRSFVTASLKPVDSYRCEDERLSSRTEQPSAVAIQPSGVRAT